MAWAPPDCSSGSLFGFGDRDGQGEDVRLQPCLGVAYAGEHQLWIADTYNHKIKCVNVQTGDCQTLLGEGQPGLQDSVHPISVSRISRSPFSKSILKLSKP
jgi:hypothetical protein